MLAAVVLAGATGKDAAAWGVRQKAHLKVGDVSMARTVLCALQKSGAEHIIYVGELPADARGLANAEIAAGAKMSDSLRAGLSLLPAEVERLLLLTADLPWLEASHLTNLLNRAPAADIVYPIIPRAATEAAFPNQRRTYARVFEGEFTGGNVFLLQPAVLPKLVELSDQLYAGRKRPLQLASLVGLRTFLGIATGRAKMRTLEQRASRLLNAEVRAFITEDAALGADIDRPEHLPHAD